jgi:hypothetical protein
MSDRGEYRSIPTVLVRGRDFRALSPEAKLVFLILKLELGPSGIDVYDLDELLPKYTGYAAAVCVRACQELRAAGWVDWEDNVVWIVRGLEFNGRAMSRTNGNHRKGLLNHVQGLPSLSIVARFIAGNAAWFDDPDSLSQRFPPGEDTLTIGCPKAIDSLSKQEIGVRKKEVGERSAIPSSGDLDLPASDDRDAVAHWIDGLPNEDRAAAAAEVNRLRKGVGVPGGLGAVADRVLAVVARDLTRKNRGLDQLHAFLMPVLKRDREGGAIAAPPADAPQRVPMELIV